MYNQLPYATDPDGVKAFLTDIDGQPEAKAAIRLFLNYFELLACGVVTDVFDIKVVSVALGSVIVDLERNYRPFVDRLRKTTNQPHLYEEIRTLAERLTDLQLPGACHSP